MNFTLTKTIEILKNTPETLEVLTRGLSDEWTNVNEGGETWSVKDVIAHLIDGELTDWMVRAAIILSPNEDKTFKPFERTGHIELSQGKSLDQLLQDFRKLRNANIELLQSKKLTSIDLDKTGIHPAFGEVTLKQLLATWAVHDLNHIRQIARVIAKQYMENVGPWINYLGILNE